MAQVITRERKKNWINQNIISNFTKNKVLCCFIGVIFASVVNASNKFKKTDCL
jgi:hypothetical protein